jgi:fructokinase
MTAICFGELLIDFVSTQRDVSVGDAPGFVKAPGGAPANVAVGLAKLGVPTAFMGQVGNDPFGHYLAGILQEQKVDISALRFSEEALTALAFVSIEASGERSFVFYRKPSADMLMRETDLDKNLLARAGLFHFGSITLIDNPVRKTTLAAVNYAQKNGALISYDPNLREPLWPDLDVARTGLKLGFEFADVVKLSEEELDFLTDTHVLETGVRRLWTQKTKLMVVTRGAEGCEAFTEDQHWVVPGYKVNVEDTIGAGDGFVAGLLTGILELGVNWPQADLQPILQRACAVGALTTTKRGAIPALPTRAEVDAFMAQ